MFKLKLLELRGKLKRIQPIGNSCFYDKTREYIPREDIIREEKVSYETKNNNKKFSSKGYTRVIAHRKQTRNW